MESVLVEIFGATGVYINKQLLKIIRIQNHNINTDLIEHTELIRDFLDNNGNIVDKHTEEFRPNITRDRRPLNHWMMSVPSTGGLYMMSVKIE